jgi:hypothetical protein|tara:strand:+ start:1707 stop:2117 length:411 start_codon:yes stop_codon:yes gene_type:complete
MNIFIKDIIIKVIVPLIIGLLIYIFYGSSNIHINKIIQFDVVPFFNLPGWAVFNLPDLLWTFSWTNLMLILWEFDLNWKDMLWFSTPLVLSILFEYAQKFGFIGGTFDTKDLFYYIFGYIIAILINLKNFTNEQKT